MDKESKHGISKKSKKPQGMDKTKVANQVWETLFQDRRKVSTREGHQKPESTGVCRNDQSKEGRNSKRETVCKTTKEYCKENTKV